ncbi:MAG TPA: NRDE family protein [Puia sp.]|nr:NRDE family protein [Puia sp.]
MCTVTYIPVNNKIIITSNRDEKHWRSTAVEPKLYMFKSGNILFPRDSDAGGTWFAAHENGNVIVFLNGGFVRHDPSPPYRKSRGIVLLDLLDSDSPFSMFLKTDLYNIEPFTSVIFDDEQLYECRWDGEKKYHKKLNPLHPYIWSSVTLYNEEVVSKRSQWFAEWMNANPLPSQTDILHFHQFTGDGDKHNDLLMDRDGFVFTVSVTSLEINTNGGLMKYLDIQNRQNFSRELIFTKAITSK